MPQVRVGSWNVERAGIAFGRAGKVAQFILDWFGVTVTPTTAYTSAFGSDSFSPYFSVASSSSPPLSSPSLSSNFVQGETLMPTFSMGGLYTPLPSKEYHHQAPKSALAAHGKTFANAGVDVLFLSEIPQGDLSELIRLIHENSGGALELAHWIKGVCGIAVVARKGQFTFHKVESSYRDLMVAVRNSSPLAFFGCHAKSGGDHDTQDDIAELLSRATQLHKSNDSSGTLISIAIGDFNTVPPEAAPTGCTVSRQQRYDWTNGSLTWTALSPGIKTRENRTLDFLWHASGRNAPAYAITTANPVTPGFGGMGISDHYPIAYDVTY